MGRTVVWAFQAQGTMYAYVWRWERAWRVWETERQTAQLEDSAGEKEVMTLEIQTRITQGPVAAGKCLDLILRIMASHGRVFQARHDLFHLKEFLARRGPTIWSSSFWARGNLRPSSTLTMRWSFIPLQLGSGLQLKSSFSSMDLTPGPSPSWKVLQTQ